MNITVTEKVVFEVKRHIMSMIEQKEINPEEPVYLRVRVQGGGCAGFINKLDLDKKYDEKTDYKSQFNGIEIVVDKRSMLYLEGAIVDFHEDLNKRGFVIKNPSSKSTCGCGSSYSL